MKFHAQISSTGKIVPLYDSDMDVYRKIRKNTDLVFEVKQPKKTRSNQQNRALHLYFTFISDELNEMGSEFIYVGLKGSELSLPYTPHIVKEFFWRRIQMTLFDIESTTELTTDQINKIIDVVNKFFSEKGIKIVFPSYESLIEGYNL